MTTRTAPRAGGGAALAFAGALLLSACGSDSPAEGTSTPDESPAADSSNIVDYQFDDLRVSDPDEVAPFIVTDQDVVISLSDELTGIVPARGVSIESYTLSAKAFPTGICRLDMTIAYNGNGAQEVQQGGDRGPEGNFVTLTDGRGFFDHTHQMVDALPSDEDIEEGMTYILSDFSRVSVVDECDSSPDDSFISANFPYSDATKYNHVFANTDIAVMQGNQAGSDGVTIAITGELPDAKVSPTGAWQIDE